MILSRTDLAAAFQVSTNTITNWRDNGLPCMADGGPGVKARYDFDKVADFLWHNSLFGFANYEEPDVAIADARQRAQAIVRSRGKKAKKVSPRLLQNLDLKKKGDNPDHGNAENAISDGDFLYGTWVKHMSTNNERGDCPRDDKCHFDV